MWEFVSLEFKQKLTAAQAREALPLQDPESLRKFDEEMRKINAGPDDLVVRPLWVMFMYDTDTKMLHLTNNGLTVPGVPETVELSTTDIRLQALPLKNHYRVLRFGDYDCFESFEAVEIGDGDLRTMGVVPEPADTAGAVPEPARAAAGGSPFAPIEQSCAIS